MLFIITTAGLAAIAAGGPNGPYVNLTEFKLGAAVNYTPVPSQTTLSGAVVAQGSLANYRIINSTTVEYILRVNEQVGDFQFGEIGLYTASGVLFAVAALASLQSKIRSLGPQIGNIVEIECRIVLTLDVTAVFQFPINSNTRELIPEIAGLQLLNTPSTSGSNVYVVHDVDDCGNSGIAYRHTNLEWSFSTHLCNFTGIIAAGTTNTNLVSTAFTFENISESSVVVPKKYILQFTTGALAGTLKYVDSRLNGNTITVNPATAGTAAVGDRFVVHKSICCGDTTVVFAGAAEYNVFATNVNRVIGVPTGTTDLDNFGYGQTPVPLVVVPQRPSKPQWDLLYTRLNSGRAHQGTTPPVPTNYFVFNNSNPLGTGLATMVDDYTAVKAAITSLSTNKNLATTLVASLPVSGLRSRSLGWTTSVQHTALFTFVDAAAMRSFFNSGGKITHSVVVTAPLDFDDTQWQTLALALQTVKVDFANAVSPSGVPLVQRGFYDLTTTQGAVYTYTMSATKRYSLVGRLVGTNSVELTASLIGPNKAGLYTGGTYAYSNTSPASTTRSYFGFEKENGTNLNTPALTAPVITYTGGSW